MKIKMFYDFDYNNVSIPHMEEKVNTFMNYVEVVDIKVVQQSHSYMIIVMYK